MFHFLITCLLVMYASLSSAHSENSYTIKYGITVPNLGTSLLTMRNASVLSCLCACSREQCCKSFTLDNSQTGEVSCTLYPHTVRKNHYEEQVGSDYYIRDKMNREYYLP